MRDNQLIDVSPLASLTGLTRLYLDNNQVSDISALTNLTGLSTIRLNNNQITDIQSLFNLINAQDINLSGNSGIVCEDLDALTALMGEGIVTVPQSCSAE